MTTTHGTDPLFDRLRATWTHELMVFGYVA